MNKDSKMLAEAYEDVIRDTIPKTLKNIGEDIANQINEGLNIRYNHPKWGKNTLLPVYDSYETMSKRFTRGDYAQYMDPKVVVSVADTSKEAQELYKTKYKTNLNTIGHKALEIVKALGEHVVLSGPHQSEKTEAIKYKGIYILLDNPLKFGLVTKNKLKGLLHKQ